MPLAGKTILVVEDEILIALALQSVLEEARAEHVEVVTSLSAADRFLEYQLPALAVLDVRLADGNSFGLGRDLLARNIPVVFHSAHTDYEDIEQFKEAVYCPKPSTPAQLIEAVQTAFGKIQLQSGSSA